MGATNQNTARLRPDEGRLPTVFGEIVTRKVRPRLWSDWKDLEAAKQKEAWR